MAEGFIPLSEIIAYGEFIEDDDMELFITLIRAMDVEYVNERSKELDKKDK